MGPGGYKKVIPKVHQMEQALLDRGIRPCSLDWPERPKNWFFGHGGSLDENGSLVFPSNLREAALRLVQSLEDSAQGTFQADRENDEFTRALQNPEHPGRTRGFGSLPWKYGFAADDDTYRSQKRRKLVDEMHVKNLEERIATN